MLITRRKYEIFVPQSRRVIRYVCFDTCWRPRIMAACFSPIMPPPLRTQHSHVVMVCVIAAAYWIMGRLGWGGQGWETEPLVEES